MTRQEIFTKVSTHLLTQGVRATGPRGCSYRGDNGTKCAVGCLISDEHYTKGLEGGSVDSLVVQEALANSGIDLDSESRSLLSSLQRLHDNCGPLTWADGLARIAAGFGLEP